MADPNLWPSTTLNDLPDPVCSHILTFLPVLSAVRTSSISRHWRNVWQSMLTLRFTPSDQNPALGLANTISLVLANRPNTISVTRFYLDFHYIGNPLFRYPITSWISYALHCGVEAMTLLFLDIQGHYEPMYRFEFARLQNSRVRLLILGRCEIVMAPIRDSNQFKFLLDLELRGVRIHDEDLLADVISRCGRLQRFTLIGPCGLDHFKIRSNSLKFLILCNYPNLSDDSSVEIHTPNLSKIELIHFFVVRYTGDRLSSVKKAYLAVWDNAMKLLAGVWGLYIAQLFPTPVLSKLRSDGSFMLERLEILQVGVWHTFEDMLALCALLERTPALKALVLNDAGPSEDDEVAFPGDFNDVVSFVAFELRIPKLLGVKMMGFRNTTFEYWMLLLLWKHRVVLREVVLVPPGSLDMPPTVLDPGSNDLMKFLVERRTD